MTWKKIILIAYLFVAVGAGYSVFDTSLRIQQADGFFSFLKSSNFAMTGSAISALTLLGLSIYAIVEHFLTKNIDVPFFVWIPSIVVVLACFFAVVSMGYGLKISINMLYGAVVLASILTIYAKFILQHETPLAWLVPVLFLTVEIAFLAFQNLRFHPLFGLYEGSIWVLQIFLITAFGTITTVFRT